MRKEKLIIHIGLHKTGTTFLQQNYFPNIENVELINSHRFFHTLGIKKTNNVKLLSNEGLSGVPWNEDWIKGKSNSFQWIYSFEDAIKNLLIIFNQPTIIIVFRKHGDLLVSLYKQYIQEGGVLSLGEFYSKDGVIKPIDLCFKKRIDILQNTFKNIYFLSYEDFKKNGANYFDNLGNNLGFKINAEFIKIYKSSNNNVSISGKKIEILRKINKSHYIPIKYLRFLRRYQISPRDIFQNHLSFWKTTDTEEMLNIKEKINKEFEEDWTYFEEFKWNYK